MKPITKEQRKRYEHLCFRLRNGVGTEDDYREAWEIGIQAESWMVDNRIFCYGEMTSKIPKPRKGGPLDPIEHMAAISEFC